MVRHESIPFVDLESMSKTVIHPHRRSFWRSVFYSRNHWRCLLFTILIHICSGILIWCHFEKHSQTGGRLFKNSGNSATHLSSTVSRIPFQNVYDNNPSVRSLTYRDLVDDEDLPSLCRPGYSYVPIVFLMLFYLIYVIEFLNCPLRMQIMRAIHIDQAYELFEQLRECAPRVWWRISCYHYYRRLKSAREIRRTRSSAHYSTIHIQDQISSSTAYCYERAVTYAAKAEYDPRRHPRYFNTPFLDNADNEEDEDDFHNGIERQDVTAPELMNSPENLEPRQYWTDVSRQVNGLENFTLTEVTFSKSFSFQSHEDERRYSYQRLAFYTAHESVDDFMETREGMDLDGVNLPTDSVMVTPYIKTQLPFYIHPHFYLCCSFLLASWPLRIIILYKTANLNYHVHKCFCSSGLRDSQGGNRFNTTDRQAGYGTPGYLSPVHTAWLNSLSDPSSCLPPSYSEALRLCDLRGSLKYSRAVSKHENNHGFIIPNNEPKFSVLHMDFNIATSSLQRRSKSCTSVYSCNEFLEELISNANNRSEKNKRTHHSTSGEENNEKNVQTCIPGNVRTSTSIHSFTQQLPFFKHLVTNHAVVSTAEALTDLQNLESSLIIENRCLTLP